MRSLDHALAILELLEHSPGGLRNTEISRQLKIATSTCSVVTAQLAGKGYLRRDEETRRYQIGLKTVALAHGALREVGFRSMAEPVLYRLASETALSAGIGMLQQRRVLLVDRVESPEFIEEAVHTRKGRTSGRARDQRDIGRELPTYSTALGKVLLAHLPPAELAGVVAGLVLTRRTSKTVVSKAKLMTQLEAIRAQGFATADEEEYEGVRALSVPIYDLAHAVRAALSLNGSPQAPVWRDEPALVALMQTAAHDISIRSRFF